MAKTATKEAETLNWLDADNGYQLAIDQAKLVCRNAKGKKLASVPKAVKEGEVAQQLLALIEWLEQHNQECLETIETWMLRSLPTPRTVFTSVWPDPAWSNILNNLVVCGVDKTGKPDQQQAGFLREVDSQKGAGVINLDGETVWIKEKQLMVPHPIVFDELDDFRQFATELNYVQRIDQLFRETYSPTEEHRTATEINEFGEGKFAEVSHVVSLCRRLGYRIRGGSSVCRVWENGSLIEARYWIGADYPEGECWTGTLIFTDPQEKVIPISDVGAVAFSEGMRMASAIYAKRVVEKEAEE